jgi:hypothetical protein
MKVGVRIFADITGGSGFSRDAVAFGQRSKGSG